MFLRHTLATLAYRADKALRDAPAGFGEFLVAPGSRTPGQILAHMGDLMDWAVYLARGEHLWEPIASSEWAIDVARFFAAVATLDAVLEHEPITEDNGRIVFQGPVADALQHVGQIAMLRRLAGAPVKGENYARATAIRVGNVGPGVPGARVEF